MEGIKESLEYVFSDGTVDVWWSEDKIINDEDNSAIYLVDEFDTTGAVKKRHVKLAVTQDDFGEYLQPRLQTLDQSAYVQVRHTWRDEYHNVVLEQYFWVNVIGNGALSKCNQEIVQKDTQTEDISLAFDANSEDGKIRHISIPRTLETIAVIEECNAVFKMLIWDSRTYTYMVWDELAVSLQWDLNGVLRSTIDFDYKTGDFEATFYHEDFEYIRARFADGDGTFNMWFQIIGTVPGSLLQGPTTPDTQKVVAEFRIKLIDETVVETCKDNVLSKLGRTVADGNSRANVLTYNVPTKDASALTMTIPSLEVRPSVENCELETHFEWHNKNHVNSDGTTGRWEGRRTTENSGRLTVDLSFGSDKKVDVTIDQRYYMDDTPVVLQDLWQDTTSSTPTLSLSCEGSADTEDCIP
jgi:hypothetical protein